MIRDEIDALPGIKERDLEPCAVCGRHHENPAFYRVTLESCVLDGKAVRRQLGLGMMMGNAAIAQALGPNEDMAKIVSSERKTLCLDCALKMPVAALL